MRTPDERTARPERLNLTEEEERLLGLVESFDPHEIYADRMEKLEAASSLTKSLIRRCAIPKSRQAYLTRPKYNIGTRMSKLEVFARNGTTGDAIFRHPNFLKYLRYLIFGPDLPKEVIEGFCELIDSCWGVTSGDVDKLWQYAKKATREFGLEKRRAAEEFYKLAIECGQEGWARSIRDSVMRTR